MAAEETELVDLPGRGRGSCEPLDGDTQRDSLLVRDAVGDAGDGEMGTEGAAFGRDILSAEPRLEPCGAVCQPVELVHQARPDDVRTAPAE